MSRKEGMAWYSSRSMNAFSLVWINSTVKLLLLLNYLLALRRACEYDYDIFFFYNTKFFIAMGINYMTQTTDTFLETVFS
jgi:hypothetical protein